MYFSYFFRKDNNYLLGSSGYFPMFIFLFMTYVIFIHKRRYKIPSLCLFFIISTNKNKGLIPEESRKQDRLVLLYLTRTASLELDSLP
jgi:hypothetical protein